MRYKNQIITNHENHNDLCSSHLLCQLSAVRSFNGKMYDADGSGVWIADDEVNPAAAGYTGADHITGVREHATQLSSRTARILG